jgi:hypothetical protein
MIDFNRIIAYTRGGVNALFAYLLSGVRQHDFDY